VFDTHAVNPALIPNLPHDTVNDFAPVMLVGRRRWRSSPTPAKPYKNFGDVIRAAKAKPEALSNRLGRQWQPRPPRLRSSCSRRVVSRSPTSYKGGGPMMADVMGGQIDLGIASVAALSANVKGGKLRALALTGDKRSHTMPDVPTLAEQGFRGFSAFAWWGIFAPAGVPKPILDKFHAELVKVLNQPDLRKQLTETLGMISPRAVRRRCRNFSWARSIAGATSCRSNNVHAD